jgi:predicted nucleotidyltransferase component of viral defense system
MDRLDYKKLYQLQDKVLDIVFTTESIFYLTGGTCLCRFYNEKRYSDDLDFFTHINDDFGRAVKNIKKALSKKLTIEVEVSSKDFIRFKVDGFLQIDFVNDRVMRYKKTIHLNNGYIIDNCENILANKITAIIGRDSPKDIFDLYLIDRFYDYRWSSILKIAHKKASFSNHDLIIRLRTFPLYLLKNITLTDNNFLDNFENEYKLVINKIEQAIENK